MHIKTVISLHTRKKNGEVKYRWEKKDKPRGRQIYLRKKYWKSE